MTSSSLTNFFLISGLVFLLIAVVGQARLGFAEINPGGCGRFLAFILGVCSLVMAAGLVIFPGQSLQVFGNSLVQQIQQNLQAVQQVELPSWLTLDSFFQS